MTTSTRIAPIPKRIALLTLATFAVGTDAFVVNGVLPEISASLHISLGTAGQLVTVFALAYAVLSPILAAVTGKWSRRTVLLGALMLFTLGNVATALAPTYAIALLSRVVAAAGASAITPTASAVASALTSAEQRGRALSLVTLGLVSSTALGVPIGTALGSVSTWRQTMWLVVAFGLVAAVGVATALPPVPGPPTVGLAERLAPLRDRVVALILTATVLLFTGVYLVTIYMSAIMHSATRGSGPRLAVLLFVSGCAGTLANVLCGGFTDRFGPRRVLGTAMAVAVLDFALFPWLSTDFVTALLAVVACGLASWSVMVPQQHSLIKAAPSTPTLVISLNASGIYLAVALAGALGASAMRMFPAPYLAWLAAGFILLGLAATYRATRMRLPQC